MYLGDIPVAVIKPTATGPAVYYVYADHLNAPRVIWNAERQVVWTWAEADPFGVALPDENPSGLGKFTYHLRFPGQYYDAETGLHHNGFRDYHPGLGRYVESDPIGLVGGLNTYAYVGVNPLNRTDPLGLEAGGSYGPGGKYYMALPQGPRIGRVIDILRNRANDMQKKDFIDGDKFYHCLAMCESAFLGPIEASVAATAGIAREMNQQYRRGDPPEECAKDNAANGRGIAAGLRGQSCVSSCQGLMPLGMTYP